MVQMLSPASYAYKKLSMDTILKHTPKEYFDSSLEGLDSSEADLLISKGTGKIWTVANKTNDELLLTSITNKDQKIHLKRFSKKSGGLILAILIQNAKNSELKLYEIGNSWSFTKNDKLLPKIKTSDFLDVMKLNNIPHETPVTYKIKGPKIIAYPVVWMNKGFEKQKLEREFIEIEWNGEKFIKKGVPKTPSLLDIKY